MHKKGSHIEYSRVLVLPDIPAIKHPVTLLTPRVPFRTGQKVVLNQRGKEVQMTLIKKLNDSGAYSQFVFRKLASNIYSQKSSAKKDDATEGNNASEFDSLWNSL